MRRALIILCLPLSACQRVSEAAQDLPPPAAYVHFDDRLAARMLEWGIPWRLPCTHTEKVVGPVAAVGSLPAEQCYKMNPPRRWQGLWRNNFEGSQFCPAPAKECSAGPSGEQIWLDFSFSLPAGLRRDRIGGLYAVDFIGRTPAYRGSYGHLGMFKHDVIVDRMIAMKELEPPAPRVVDGTLK